MLYGLVGILLRIVIIFGIASGMQSYAAAEQARAQSAVAQVAQINAWGNLIVILVLALLIVSVLALIAWLVLRQMKTGRRINMERQLPYEQNALSLPTVPPTVSIETLIQLETLRVLRAMNGNAPQPLPFPLNGEENRTGTDELHWLRGS